MESLEDLGWDESWAAALPSDGTAGLHPARVAVEHRGLYTLAGADGQWRARAARRLERQGGHSARPVVGDWVAVRPPLGDGDAFIEAVLPRRTALSRRAPGMEEAEQVLAANVDVVFLLSGLDRDFNPRRMERALLLVWESGAQPVILLNKVDLCDEVAARCREMEAVSGGVPVHPIGALAAVGLQPVYAALGRGRTAVMIGSSGVGKSTLANRLLGELRLDTGPVREHDSRGRHTTTHRELLRVPGGGLLIDTPGLRELQLWAPETALDQVFADLEELGHRCRFGDCRHEGEPGCAVAEAVAAGAIGPDRLASYHKLQKELRHHQVRVDARVRQEQKRKWRSIHRLARNHRPRE